VLIDQYRSIEEGGQARLPVCSRCGDQMEWLPQVGRIDSFTPFETLDGRNQPVVIDSLSKLRKVERESEQIARNGEGQHLTWRKYSQDHSNVLVNTHGPDPSERPDPEAVKKLAPRRHGELEPAHEYGPAVTDGNTSVLSQEI
jgi:hypothetical protein